MKLELLTLFLENGLYEQSNHLLNLAPFPLKYFDWELRKNICTGVYLRPEPEETKHNEVPYEIRISSLDVNDKIKTKAYDKLKMINNSQDGAPKAQKWLDGLLKIPFNIIKSEPDLDDPGKKLLEDYFKKYPDLSEEYGNPFRIFKSGLDNPKTTKFADKCLKVLEKSRDKQQQYMSKVSEILDDSVYGHELVKTQIKRLLAQWISGGQSGIVLGIEGPPGTGKTMLIKHGLAKCLVDQQGKSRPVGFIPLGGLTTASSINGHSYTYQGSEWGRILSILMDSECMNPIFMFDELDKVSATEHGREVTSILTHLTDPTQNDEYYDKYFDGVPLDLSKALMVFTFNNRSKIDPILLDRMTIITTDPLSLQDKQVVCRTHLIPQITKMIDLEPTEIKVSDEIVENLISTYTMEAGARQLKKLLESLIQELNLRRLLNPHTELVITEELIDEVFSHKDKVRIEYATEKPLIGQINGMYANGLGLGGILPIQVTKNVFDDKLVLTGTQGDVMKESMNCAKNTAYTLLYECDLEEEKQYSGLHIHCPSTSTPKDGPSAGGAIALAIFSYLSQKPLNQHVSMTGEIDMLGNILPIGGVEAKLNGAKKAGIKTALIPSSNLEQLERLRTRDKSPEDDTFSVVTVEHVKEAMNYFF